MSDESENETEAETAPARSPAYDRLAASIARLTAIIQSGSIQSELRELTLTNPVHHAGITIDWRDANVVEVLLEHGRPVPRLRLLPSQVSALPRLIRVGFVADTGATVALTARGRALGLFRQQQRWKSRNEASRMRSWIDGLESLGP